MPRVPINNIGLQGLILDRPKQFLPPAAWTSALNVRMRDGGVHRFDGELKVFGTPLFAPKWVMAVPSVGAYFWLYADNSNVAVWNGTTHTDISKAGGYSGNDDELWTGVLLGGVPVLNNSADVPQYWPTLDTGTKLADLANWPAGVLCKSIRAFGPFLLALNITKSGTEFPNMVKWSHPADPGAVPTSWDETDATKDAGEVELTDVFAGGLVDGIPLGGVFIVYKENSAHILRRLQNRFIFDFDPLFPNTGILGKHCAVEVPGQGVAFLATGDDVVLHGLQRGEMRSVVDGRARRFLQNDVDDTNFNRSFVVNNERQKEVWFCYPEAGATWPSKALVWNYVDDTVSFRELSEVSFAANGVVDESLDLSWDSDTENWDSDTSTWQAGIPGAQQQSILMCLPVASALHKADSGNDFNGTAIEAHVERNELTVVGVDRQGQPMVDLQVVKLVKRLWIKATGAQFNVRAGVSDEEDSVVTWSSTEMFTPGVDKYVDFEQPVAGRFVHVRFESLGGVGWTIEGYDLEVEPVGTF